MIEALASTSKGSDFHDCSTKLTSALEKVKDFLTKNVFSDEHDAILSSLVIYQPEPKRNIVQNWGGRDQPFYPERDPKYFCSAHVGVKWTARLVGYYPLDARWWSAECFTQAQPDSTPFFWKQLKPPHNELSKTWAIGCVPAHTNYAERIGGHLTYGRPDHPLAQTFAEREDVHWRMALRAWPRVSTAAAPSGAADWVLIINGRRRAAEPQAAKNFLPPDALRLKIVDAFEKMLTERRRDSHIVAVDEGCGAVAKALRRETAELFPYLLSLLDAEEGMRKRRPDDLSRYLEPVIDVCAAVCGLTPHGQDHAFLLGTIMPWSGDDAVRKGRQYRLAMANVHNPDAPYQLMPGSLPMREALPFVPLCTLPLDNQPEVYFNPAVPPQHLEVQGTSALVAVTGMPLAFRWKEKLGVRSEHNLDKMEDGPELYGEHFDGQRWQRRVYRSSRSDVTFSLTAPLTYRGQTKGAMSIEYLGEAEAVMQRMTHPAVVDFVCRAGVIAAQLHQQADEVRARELDSTLLVIRHDTKGKALHALPYQTREAKRKLQSALNHWRAADAVSFAEKAARAQAAIDDAISHIDNTDHLSVLVADSWNELTAHFHLPANHAGSGSPTPNNTSPVQLSPVVASAKRLVELVVPRVCPTDNPTEQCFRAKIILRIADDLIVDVPESSLRLCVFNVLVNAAHHFWSTKAEAEYRGLDANSIHITTVLDASGSQRPDPPWIALPIYVSASADRDAEHVDLVIEDRNVRILPAHRKDYGRNPIRSDSASDHMRVSLGAYLTAKLLRRHGGDLCNPEDPVRQETDPDMLPPYIGNRIRMRLPRVKPPPVSVAAK